MNLHLPTYCTRRENGSVSTFSCLPTSPPFGNKKKKNNLAPNYTHCVLQLAVVLVFVVVSFAMTWIEPGSMCLFGQPYFRLCTYFLRTIADFNFFIRIVMPRIERTMECMCTFPLGWDNMACQRRGVMCQRDVRMSP